MQTAGIIQPSRSTASEGRLSLTLFQRFPGVDAMRGFSIVLMVCYHVIFDLHQFGALFFGRVFHFPHWLRAYPPYLIGTLFFTLVGVSAWLKARSYDSPSFSLFRNRAVQILAGATATTLASILFFPEGKIYFGVLHCIGVSYLLVAPFLNYTYLNLLVGLALIGLGAFTQTITVSHPWLLWLGFLPANFSFGDYYPLLPWFGVTLIGVFLGRKLYPKNSGAGVRGAEGSVLEEQIVFRSLVFLGKHSLLIYLIHQPILLGSLYLLGRCLQHLGR